MKHFGEAGAEAIMKELEQLLYQKVMKGRMAYTLTKEEKKAAPKYLMFLKENGEGRILPHARNGGGLLHKATARRFVLETEKDHNGGNP